jgi:hypothetical protein
VTTPPRIEVALERLRYSAQNTKVPELDVDALEERILAEATRSRISSAFVSLPRHRWPLWTTLSVAAAICVFVATQKLRHDAIATPSLPARGALANEVGIDGSTLGINQGLVAIEHDVLVKHTNLATWRLVAPGKAKLIENGKEHVTIALESGLIQAEVVTQPKPESFVIEVARARVAVHGTVFSVERHGTRAEVVVREGKVMVSNHAREGAIQNTLLSAPSRAELDVGNEFEPNAVATLTTTTSLQNPSQAHTSPTTTVSKPSSTKTTSTPLADTPSVEQLDRLWIDVAKRVSNCFDEHTAKNTQVRVSFKTELSLGVDRSGAIKQISFNPPVPEPVRACALEQVARLSTSPSRNGAFVSHPTVLAN